MHGHALTTGPGASSRNFVRTIFDSASICLDCSNTTNVNNTGTQTRSGRSHVLLPRFCLGRRVDAVAVIWPTQLARAAGWGWRRICAAGGRPASTVRGWLSRFAAHAEPIRVGFARLEWHANAGADMDRLAPAASRVADAVAQIGAACAAVHRAAGPAVFEVSSAELVVACSGGWLLATRPPAVAALSINTGPRL